MSYLFYCFCFRSKLRKDYRRKLDNAAAQIEKELDLGRFIRRQRQHTIATLSLLRGRQAHIVNKMSKLTVSDGPAPINFAYGSSSGVEQGGDQKIRTMNSDSFVKRAFEGTDKVDRRLLHLL